MLKVSRTDCRKNQRYVCEVTGLSQSKTSLAAPSLWGAVFGRSHDRHPTTCPNVASTWLSSRGYFSSLSNNPRCSSHWRWAELGVLREHGCLSQGSSQLGFWHFVLPLWRALMESGTGAFLHGTAALHVLGRFYCFFSFFCSSFFFFLFPSPLISLPTCLHLFWDGDLWLLLQRLQGSNQITDYGTVPCNPNPINSHSCSLAHTQR